VNEHIKVIKRGRTWLIERWYMKPGQLHKGWFAELIEVTPCGASKMYAALAASVWKKALKIELSLEFLC